MIIADGGGAVTDDLFCAFHLGFYSQIDRDFFCFCSCTEHSKGLQFPPSYSLFKIVLQIISANNSRSLLFCEYWVSRMRVVLIGILHHMTDFGFPIGQA